MAPTKLLTIAVPTYNRPDSLHSLLSTLSEATQKYPQVQILVSDNHSPSPTPEILSTYENNDQFVIIKNSRNIGAVKNILKIFQSVNSDWLLILGDDDNIDIDHLGTMLMTLERLPANTWVLSNTLQPTVAKDRLKGLSPGFCSATRLCIYLAIKTLSKLGFIGVHIIPTNYTRHLLHSLQHISQWPHLALFLSSLDEHSSIFISKLPLVIKKAEGVQLSWQPYTWFRVNLDKAIVIYSNLSPSIPRLVKYILISREVLSLENHKNLLFWHACLPAHFSNTYTTILDTSLNGIFSFFSIYYKTISRILLLLPFWATPLLIKITFQSGRLRRYKLQIHAQVNDAEFRGL